MNILLLEDNPLDADLARRALMGHSVTAVSTLNEAWERLLDPSATWQVVILDVFLPDGTSANLVTRIRLHRLPVAIVILSGNQDLELTLLLLRLGADDFLTKDIGAFTQLGRTVETARDRYLSDCRRSQHSLVVLYAEPIDLDFDLTQRYVQSHASHVHLIRTRTPGEVLGYLQRSGGEQIQVVMLDLNLPGSNALTLLKELRLNQGVTIPIVVVTGLDSNHHAVEALRLGATDWVVKHPNYLPGLIHQIESAHHQYLLTAQHREVTQALAKYQGVLDGSRDVIVACDRRGIITLANRTCRELMGPEDVVGTSLDRLVIPEDRPGLQGVLERLEDEEHGSVMIVRMAPPHGGHVPFEWRIQPVRDQDLRFVSYQVIGRDLSGYLPRADELLSEHTASRPPVKIIDEVRSAGHDLNNLATITLGHLQLLRPLIQDRPAGVRHLDHAERATLRGVDLVHQLQSRLRGGPVGHAESSLQKILREAGQLTRGALPARIHLDMHEPLDDLLVPMAAEDLLRILINLILNARDACPAGGDIHVSAHTDENGLRPSAVVVVQDNGVGIPLDVKPLLLHTPITTKGPGRGTGLGLVTCRRLVEAAGGSIQVDSTPGEGTCVTMLLPVVTKPAPTQG